MKYLLDTDVIIEYLRGKEKLNTQVLEEGATISIVTLGELLYGAYKSAIPDRALTIVHSFLFDLLIASGFYFIHRKLPEAICLSLQGLQGLALRSYRFNLFHYLTVLLRHCFTSATTASVSCVCPCLSTAVILKRYTPGLKDGA